jgi:hypothetical protein
VIVGINLQYQPRIFTAAADQRGSSADIRPICVDPLFHLSRLQACEDRKDRALRVLDHGEASDVRDVSRRNARRGA